MRGLSRAMRVFVQARMSSSRFPGKALAPFRGQPLIRHVVEAVQAALPSAPLVVATSADPTDDPLAAYLATLGVQVFRGPLDNVFERMRRCLLEHPCEWMLRVNGDSPLLDARVLQAVAHHPDRERADVITTIFPRTFPLGQNAEMIRVQAFLDVDPAALSPEEQEHVTSVFYRSPGRFRIINVESGRPELAQQSLAVDMVADLERLAALPRSETEPCRSTRLHVSPR